MPVAVAPLEIDGHNTTESQWLFTEEELLQSPSILEGLPAEKERENRSKGVNFIVQVGIMLRLPQITLTTAAIFLHRFYMRCAMPAPKNNETGYHYYAIAATSIFLATKVEENCRKMKELVVACVRVAQKAPYKVVDEQDKEYWRWRDNILVNEDILLEMLCFDLRLDPPYKVLYDVLLAYGEEEHKKLRNAAWSFISDSCLTTLCLLFPSRTIAASALYAAARHSDVALPDDEHGRPWWDTINVQLKDINKACKYMGDVYRSSSVKGAQEPSIYDDATSELNYDSDITRLKNRYSSYPNVSSSGAASPSLKRAFEPSGGYESLLEVEKGRTENGDNESKRQRLIDENEPDFESNQL